VKVKYGFVLHTGLSFALLNCSNWESKEGGKNENFGNFA
jgi:hypothetical protein